MAASCLDGFEGMPAPGQQRKYQGNENRILNKPDAMSNFKVGDTVVCKKESGEWYCLETNESCIGPEKGEQCLVVHINHFGALQLQEYSDFGYYENIYFEKKSPLTMTYKKREDIEKEHPDLILMN